MSQDTGMIVHLMHPEKNYNLIPNGGAEEIRNDMDRLFLENPELAGSERFQDRRKHAEARVAAWMQTGDSRFIADAWEIFTEGAPHRHIHDPTQRKITDYFAPSGQKEMTDFMPPLVPDEQMVE